MLRRTLLALLTGALLAATPTTAHALTRPIPADTSCRSGAVHLTFDDGPQAADTKRLLGVLRKHKARATFYVQGARAKGNGPLIKRMAADGHSVQNHSWSHPRLIRMSSRQVDGQLRRTSAVIKALTGVAPKYMRPPYGENNAMVRSVIKKNHMRQALWTIDTNDWRGYSSATIRRNALGPLRKHRSNVVLMHDGAVNAPRTVAAVPGIIAGLRKRGFCTKAMTKPPKLVRLTAKSRRFVEPTSHSRVVTVRLRLDKRSPYDAAVRVRTVSGSARAGVDFKTIRSVRRIKKGANKVDVRVRIYGHRQVTGVRSLLLRFDNPVNLRRGTKKIRITIADSKKWAPPAPKPSPKVVK